MNSVNSVFPSYSVVFGVTKQLSPLDGILRLAEYFAMDGGVVYEQMMHLLLRFTTGRPRRAAAFTGFMCDALDAYMFDLTEEAGGVFPLKPDAQEEAGWRSIHIAQQSSMPVISEVMEDFLHRVAFYSEGKPRVGKLVRGDFFCYRTVFLVKPRSQTFARNSCHSVLRTDMGGTLSNTRASFATAFWQAIPWAQLTMNHRSVSSLVTISDLRPRLLQDRGSFLTTFSGYYRRLISLHVTTPYQQPYLCCEWT